MFVCTESQEKPLKWKDFQMKIFLGTTTKFLSVRFEKILGYFGIYHKCNDANKNYPKIHLSEKNQKPLCQKTLVTS